MAWRAAGRNRAGRGGVPGFRELRKNRRARCLPGAPASSPTHAKHVKRVRGRCDDRRSHGEPATDRCPDGIGSGRSDRPCAMRRHRRCRRSRGNCGSGAPIMPARSNMRPSPTVPPRTPRRPPAPAAVARVCRGRSAVSARRAPSPLRPPLSGKRQRPRHRRYLPRPGRATNRMPAARIRPRGVEDRFVGRACFLPPQPRTPARSCSHAPAARRGHGRSGAGVGGVSPFVIAHQNENYGIPAISPETR